MACQVHPEVEEALQTCSRCGQSFCSDCLVELRGEYYCASCKLEQIRDIQSGTDSTHLEFASIGRRFVAILVDGLVIAIPTIGLSFLLFFLLLGASIFDPETFSKPGTFVVKLLIGLIAALPGLLYEGLMLQARGQTLGKMALRIKVVTPEGAAITLGQAWTRALTRVLLAHVPYIGLILDYVFVFGKERTCLHDKAAKTRVIRLP